MPSPRLAPKRPSVLVVDDERDVIELVRYNLEKNGFEVIGATNGESGYEVAVTNAPDLIVLDVMMPGVDGLEVCRRLRKERRTAGIPLILLTAKATEADRVVGLELGADDYVTKPFSPRELVARVRAVLRRFAPAGEPIDILRIGDLLIDLGRHEVSVRGRTIDLTATEFRILQFLAGKPGRVWSRTDIIDSAMGRDEAVIDRTVDVHITALRRKLGRAGDLIQTVRGFGYRMQDEVLKTAARS